MVSAADVDCRRRAMVGMVRRSILVALVCTLLVLQLWQDRLSKFGDCLEVSRATIGLKMEEKTSSLRKVNGLLSLIFDHPTLISWSGEVGVGRLAPH